MGSLWDACEQPDENLHAALRYDDVAASGPPARPLDFPAPTVYRCEKVDILARDHRSGSIHSLKNVIIRSELDNFGRRSDVAYLVKKKLGKSVYGTIKLCIVLKRCEPVIIREMEERQDSSPPSMVEEERIEWESTDLKAVIKASEWSRIYAMRGRHLEDPIREISAMQLLGNYHPNVAGALEILQDEACLYAIMPHFPEGDLYGRLAEASASNAGQAAERSGQAPNEAQCRVWFRQLLDALFHLQKKGVCHRDISLENILLDEHDRIVLIDPGMSLRVPYSDPCNYGCVTDVSAGTNRRLMVAQGQGGNLIYAAPEIVEHDEFVDAFAIDLWSAGVVLFIMLVGMAPFKWAHPSDKRYYKISKGGLKEVMAVLDIPLSPEAIDLLQGFFWRNPRKRFTLAEVLEHPWVQGKPLVSASTSPSNCHNPETLSAPNMCESRRFRFPRSRLLVEPNF